MTKLQRIKEIISALIMILLALLIISSPAEGYELVIYIFASYFTLKGISTIIYYITMARFMVDGRTSLYIGVILLDLGILTFTLTDVPYYYVVIYLIALHALKGAIEVLRAREARCFGALSWRLKMVHGALDIITALICIIFIRHLSIAVIIYAAGLIYSSALRIVSACRRTKPVELIPQ